MILEENDIYVSLLFLDFGNINTYDKLTTSLNIHHHKVIIN